MNAVALVVAVLAAVGFAVSTSLQHHANAELGAHKDTRPVGAGAETGRQGSRSHLASLLRQPWWVIGQVVAFAAFALHAWALNIGLLLVVQPVVVSGIVLAVPVRAALERRLPAPGEIGTVALTATGLATFLIAVHPSAVGADHAANASGPVATFLGIAAAAVTARWAGSRTGLARATGYGVASGVLFGLTAGLVKLTAVSVASAPAPGATGHLLALVTAWSAWLVPLVGIGGVVLNQRAYRAGPLSASMPVLNIVDVLVAIAFGVVVFGETPAHHPLDLAGQTAGTALMLVGLQRLARSHALAEEADDSRPSLPVST